MASIRTPRSSDTSSSLLGARGATPLDPRTQIWSKGGDPLGPPHADLEQGGATPLGPPWTPARGDGEGRVGAASPVRAHGEATGDPPHAGMAKVEWAPRRRYGRTVKQRGRPPLAIALGTTAAQRAVITTSSGCR